MDKAVTMSLHISLIVPVYQVESYIKECLDSLISQTYTNLEIIVVNDGSTDRSIEIAQAMAQSDNRIRIINKENGGLSSARNAGIEAARGNVLLFVDSDDMLTDNTCEIVATTFESACADIVTFGGYPYPAEAGDWWLNKVLSPRDVIYTSFAPDLLFKENSRPFVWRTAVTMEFLKRTSLLFDEDVLFGEDQIFQFMAYPQAKTTVLLSNKLYLYRQNREGSLMQDYAFKKHRRLTEHQNIVRIILEGWVDKGWVERWPSEIFVWVLDFLIYEISHLEHDERVKYMNMLRAMIVPFVSGRNLKADGMRAASRSIYRSILQSTETQAKLSDWQMMRFYLEQHGLKEAAKAFFKRLFKKA